MQQILNEEKLKEIYRNKETDFTRCRQQPFNELILFMMNLIRKSLQIEIINFFELLKKQNLRQSIQSITKSAFVQNRRKVKPELFKYLLSAVNKEFYTDNDENIELWKGFRLLSVDGSRVTLPITKELKDKYGVFKNQHETELVIGRASVLYDVLNSMIIDGILAPSEMGERELALQHLEYCTTNDLIIYDRGYPSFEFIYEHMIRGINYIIRCKHDFNWQVKEFVSSKEESRIIDFKPGKNTIFKGKSFNKNTTVKVRLIKIEISDGEIEILMTSLLDTEKYKTSIFKEVYFKRWGIETFYDVFKNKLQVENFSGYSDIAIQQDFNCTLLIRNLQSVILKDMNEEAKEKYKDCKYQYKINNNISIGIMKNRVVELLMNETPEVVLEELKSLLILNVIPIRPDRKYERHKDKYRTRKKPVITKNFKNAL